MHYTCKYYILNPQDPAAKDLDLSPLLMYIIKYTSPQKELHKVNHYHHRWACLKFEKCIYLHELFCLSLSFLHGAENICSLLICGASLDPARLN